MNDTTSEAPSQPCCLIVEDQALIGMALEAYLEETGFKVAGPFLSREAALGWLEGHTPELALLDFKLQDGPCTDLARSLRSRGVPFIVYSGHRRGADTPPELQDVPWIEKPVDRAELLSALARCARRPDRGGRDGAG